MLVPILFCIGAACLCGEPSLSSRTSSPRRGTPPRSPSLSRAPSRPVPRRGDHFGAALCYAVGRRYDAERTVAYVLSRVAPGRENDRQLAGEVAAEVKRRLAQPDFRASCGGRG